MQGTAFGALRPVAGEVVFNTGMVGYPETLTDPSYTGQILVITYPLVGNYGVPGHRSVDDLEANFESDKIWIAGLVVSDVAENHNHWNADISLHQWLQAHRIPAVSGIDTRLLTKRLRQKGSMLGTLAPNGNPIDYYDPNKENLVSRASVSEPVVYERGKKKVILVDCGCKNNIIRSLLQRNITVIRVPWDFDFSGERYDGLLISNGPGDPKMCSLTVEHVRKAMDTNKPIFGICLGNQILALAAGADTYKLKFGHRSQNQPCLEAGTKRCYITSQNHGYAVDTKTLKDDWRVWFTNANDGTNEGIRHCSRPFFSVQFHPEASPGPVDTDFLFDRFVSLLA
jgi:carbamoyl-phosphate synthase small subunit